ncbi:transporter substrate-binding domain-containing protein [Virgibacillus halodenitrificans]|jgi:polar amino acid transport system substrate-binding protein|uniref:transporter substrate-binding domain-containing protein n=1 Tax=Virgibacillus halodenitrificans TaxID=1482 RepID=UPI0003104583|nr:transporter substrate-binding domain-containing protein [Virgibacillus halodenitrificans]MCG1027884.1 transporter substrate-binding domain-containing protein [Virgibacillus halodenitrificans]MYL56005.1 transporter substrate-binding domain-containing protein [Virgibacillus halodenitrificans]CDQ36900.1 Arginine-binding extracellular protein ArtP precursor [Virgibacillus halodenitrificans]
MKRLNIALILVIITLMLAACGAENETEADTSSAQNGKEDNYNLVEKGKLTFAASGEFKPFSYMEGSKMVGYDIAVAEAIAEKLGLEAVQQKAKFSGIVTGVNQGRYDIAVASHTITDERLEQVNFSDPYYYSGPVIYTRTDSDIEKANDLKGKEISVSRGSTYVEMAQEYTDNIPQVDSDVVALQSLAKGHHDAVITDDITGKTAIENGLDIENRGQLGVSEQAVAVAKDDQKLLEDINNALKELKESGDLAALAEKWVGVDITEKPEEIEE